VWRDVFRESRNRSASRWKFESLRRSRCVWLFLRRRLRRIGSHRVPREEYGRFSDVVLDCFWNRDDLRVRAAPHSLTWQLVMDVPSEERQHSH